MTTAAPVARFRGGGVGCIQRLLWMLLLTLLTLGLYLLFAVRGLGIWRWRKTELDGQRLRYRGTLLGWIKGSLLDAILMALTAGLYAPWAFASEARGTFEALRLKDGRQLRWTGRGDQVIGLAILSAVLTPMTAGVAWPWLHAAWRRWLWEHVELEREDGWRKLRWTGSGNELLPRLARSALLTLLTLGLYLPWAIADFLRWDAAQVELAP